jgi:hypothetical protein
MEARRFRKHVEKKIYGKQTYGIAGLTGNSKVYPTINDEILERSHILAWQWRFLR